MRGHAVGRIRDREAILLCVLDTGAQQHVALPDLHEHELVHLR